MTANKDTNPVVKGVRAATEAYAESLRGRPKGSKNKSLTISDGKRFLEENGITEEEIKKEETKKKLNLKQLRFCQYYVANGGNGTNAACKAGYSEKNAAETASILLKNSQISGKIMEIENDHAEAISLTIEYKYRLLKKCSVVLEKELEEKEKQSTAKALVAVLAETNKMAGHYAPARELQQHLITATEDKDTVQKLIDEFDKEY